jgi:hypothetical protein
MFRYFVGVVFQPDEDKFTSRHVIVRSWETNLNPRLIRKDGMCLLIPYIFGTFVCKNLMKEHLWCLFQLFQITIKIQNQTSLACMTVAR